MPERGITNPLCTKHPWLPLTPHGLQPCMEALHTARRCKVAQRLAGCVAHGVNIELLPAGIVPRRFRVHMSNM